MQQVPNAIPKVIRRTGGANSLELEKENFERGQVWSASSCINITVLNAWDGGPGWEPLHKVGG